MKWNYILVDADQTTLAVEHADTLHGRVDYLVHPDKLWHINECRDSSSIRALRLLLCLDCVVLLR